jgi:hypothetical protein
VPDLTQLSGLASGYEAALGWAGVGSLAMLVGSLVLLYFFITRMPADYFAEEEAPPRPWEDAHSALGVTVHVARNVAGLVLLVAGIAMLVLPGQGLLTILMAVILLEFPGKRRIELALVRRRQICSGLNWIRERAGRAPFVVFPAEEV